MATKKSSSTSRTKKSAGEEKFKQEKVEHQKI